MIFSHPGTLLILNSTSVLEMGHDPSRPLHVRKSLCDPKSLNLTGSPVRNLLELQTSIVHVRIVFCVIFCNCILYIGPEGWSHFSCVDTLKGAVLRGHMQKPDKCDFLCEEEPSVGMRSPFPLYAITFQNSTNSMSFEIVNLLLSALIND